MMLIDHSASEESALNPEICTNIQLASTFKHNGNLLHIYLSVGVENFEWFLQEGKLRFLDELDRFKQEFGAVVHTQFSILDLLGFQIYFYISSNIFFLLFLNHTPFNKDGFRAYLDNGFASFLLYNNISSYSER